MNHPPQALARTLSLPGAVLLGLGSILGTGAFVALGLAAGIAGPLAAPALAIAVAAATFNGLSSAQLAAAHPVSGGAYAYGRRLLSPMAGFVAGVTFLCAKTASAAAAALGLAGYLAPVAGGMPQAVLALCGVAAMTVLILLGMRSASGLNAALVTVTVAVLVTLPALALIVPPGDGRPPPAAPSDAPGIKDMAQAAALLFVAFAGYGRIATLGEDVRSPHRTIPRAIVATLILSALLYAAVLWAGLTVLGAQAFARATRDTAAPLSALAERLGGDGLVLAIGIGAATALASVLLNLILGLSRVILAMGREGDLPGIFGRLDQRGQPMMATLLAGGVVALIALSGGFEAVWSFSAVTVLIYYAIMNGAALCLRKDQRLYTPAVPLTGLALCLGLAAWVDEVAWLWGLTIIIGSVAARAIRLAVKQPGL